MHSQQVQVFIGPKNCDKTLTQEQIITPLFGGREAEPFAYLSGLTRFNNDLFAAEHHKMSDEIATSDSDKCREFGDHDSPQSTRRTEAVR